MFQKTKFLLATITFSIAAIWASYTHAVQLQPDQQLFSPDSQMNVGAGQAQAPDAFHEPQSRLSPNQVPEKLEFVFQGHQYGMQRMGETFVSDYQTLLQDIEYVNRNAWRDLYNRSQDEFLNYSSPGTPATLASSPAGALAIAALDNAGAVGRQNVQFGVPFLFQGLGLQDGSDCQGTVRGMLEGKCKWGTPPVILDAIFSNIIGGDTNLNQLNGAYEVWGVAPARATLISLIFNQGLFD